MSRPPTPLAFRITRYLVTAAVVGAISSPTPGQEPPRYGVPERVELDGMTDMGAGGQMSPDGRLILRAWAHASTWGGSGDRNGWPRNTENGQSNGTPTPIKHGWAVQVVRPENITKDSAGQPVFTTSVFSPTNTNSLGHGYLIEPGADLGDSNGEHAAATYGNDFFTNPNHVLPVTRRGSGFPGAVASGIPQKAHTTWFPDPILDKSPSNETPASNPYACDENGVPINGIPAPGQAPGSVQYIAYEMISITHAPHYDRTPSGNTHIWVHDSEEDRLLQVPMKVVVKDPYSANATIHKAWVTKRYEEVTWGANNDLMYLSEQSITRNGHFLVGHGPLPSEYDSSLTKGNNRFPSKFKFGGTIWATWNSTPGSASGWHEPVILSELHEFGDDILSTPSGGIPLEDMIRLAKEPMRYQNGNTVGEKVVQQQGNSWVAHPERDASLGAYPWVHWDGDGILYPICGARGTIAYCGVRTNYTFASLDAANFSHLCILAEEYDKDNEEHVMGGLMAMTGMWDVYRDTPAGRAVLDAHPAHPREPVLSFMHGANEPQRLTTMSLEDWSDGEYQVFLRMTPLVKRIDLLSKTYGSSYQGYPWTSLWTRLQLDKAADTSGNYHVSRLKPFADPMNASVIETEAAFTVRTSDERPYGNGGINLPFRRPNFDTEASAGGHVEGKVGESVRLGKNGFIEIKNGMNTPGGTSSLQSDAVSIEAFVRPSPTFVGISPRVDTRLFHHQDRISVWIDGSGSLRVELTDPDVLPIPGQPPPPPVTFTTVPVLLQSQWYHVAITFADGVLHCYLDGEDIGNATLLTGPLAVSPVNVFEVGPNGNAPSYDAILLHVDEFRLSRIARRPQEIRRHAFVETAAWVTDSAKLPPLAGTPVKPEDCRVAIGREWTQAKHDFGEHVFSSTKLSVNDNFSCASCHDANQSFSDGKALAIGHSGVVGDFSTPTIFNSVTGREMFWDMRARDLADQATQPITNPDELGHPNLNAALNALMNLDPTAVSLHAAAFNGSSQITKSTLEQGLESFMQAQIAPNTAVETYESGSTFALTLAEKRGRSLFATKARCVACHHGPSMTNFLAQNTGAATLGQVGRRTHTGRQRDLGAFKTPTLRLTTDMPPASGPAFGTAPYFHDGFGTTLSDVIEFYDLGGGQAGVDAISTGRTAIGETHVDMMRLGLTGQEKADLLAFLRRLGGS